MDSIKARHLSKDAEQADRWASQLRAREQHLRAEADRVAAEAAAVEARADANRAEAAVLTATNPGQENSR